jgi:RNA polymerase sigma-70 factor (ECF subfamily)
MPPRLPPAKRLVKNRARCGKNLDRRRFPVISRDESPIWRTISGVSREGDGGLWAASMTTAMTAATPTLDFQALYREQFQYVFRTLRRLGVRQAEIDDLAQEVFTVVFRRLGDYDPDRPVQPWLFGIAFRIASVYHRTRSRRIVEIVPDSIDFVDDAAPGPEAGPEESLDDRRARRLVLQALDSLDLAQRAVFVMHDIDGQPARAIADTLGVPLNTVYSRLRVARARFATRVRKLKSRDDAGGQP